MIRFEQWRFGSSRKRQEHTHARGTITSWRMRKPIAGEESGGSEGTDGWELRRRAPGGRCVLAFLVAAGKAELLQLVA